VKAPISDGGFSHHFFDSWEDGLGLLQERIQREYDAYHWMQQMHEASKKYP
jgi:hypothetical protein